MAQERRSELTRIVTWYKKAAEYIQSTSIQVAFVSTNSIVQGKQVGDLWGFLLSRYQLYINFAHRTFKWSNEAKGKAAVHCVIIGFATFSRKERVIYEYKDIVSTPQPLYAKNINPYLLDAENILIKSRYKPLCNAPEMVMGNQAMDGGNLIIEASEYEEFIIKESNALPYIKKYMMGNEFINNEKRYCLWLKDCPPAELRKMPFVMERVTNVQKMRADSNDSGARKLAKTPTLFRESRNPEHYIAIPITSSERREYIPIGYLDKSTIAGNTLFIIPDGNIYIFGILTSNIHMYWTKTVGARLKSDYRYSKDIVYNNFPWPNPNDKQKENISVAAQKVLEVRALYPDSSLADLYDPLTMPPELVKAHNVLDRAVMTAYGYKGDLTEAQILKTNIGKWMKAGQLFAIKG